MSLALGRLFVPLLLLSELLLGELKSSEGVDQPEVPDGLS